MANSNRKRIIDNIVSTLGAITTGGGYNFSVGQAIRGFKSFGAIPEDKFPAIVVSGADENRKNVTNTQFRSDLLVTVIAYVKVADATDKEALEQAIDNLIEDMTKALYVDITRGGYSRTTEIGEINTDQGSFEGYGMVELVVRCDYTAHVSAP